MGAKPRGQSEQVLTFRVGGRYLALAASEVAEVIRHPRLTRVPHAPAALSGVTSVRGRVVPVLSLSTLLGDETAVSGKASRIVLLNRSPSLGLHVDEVISLSAPSKVTPHIEKGQLVEVD